MGKKLRERLAREEASAMATRVKKSILWKIFRFSFKTLYIMAFIFYLMMGTGLTYAWGLKKWYRHYPPEYAGVLCKKYALGPRPRPDKIAHWLMARNASEADVIMAKLESCTPFLPSIVFLNFSAWKFEQGKMEEGLNWRQYARFRARYDALRCGSPDAPESFNDILELSGREEVQHMMERNPSLQPKSIRWALDYDAKFPPPQNDPVELCQQLNAMSGGKFNMVERQHWGGIHDTLRSMSYIFIRMMEEDIAKGGRGVIDMPKRPELPGTEDSKEQDGEDKKE